MNIAGLIFIVIISSGDKNGIFLEILKEINITQIIIIFTGMWFFYNRLDNKIDRVENRLADRIDKVENSLNERIDRVENSLNERIDKVERKLELIQDKLMTRIDNLYNLFAGFLCNKKG